MNFEQVRKESLEERKSRTAVITKLLSDTYPEPKSALNFTSPLELLVAAILSAQTTDKQVNIVTEDLFKKYRSAQDFANADPEEFIQDIRTIGFYKNKAANIIKCCRQILEKYHGKVPRTMDELTSLPGIGRKTANVILGNAFGINSGIAVDTHVIRVSGRLGITEHTDPEKIEQDLIKLVPQITWTDFSHYLIYHGRNTCVARKPKCGICIINKYCPSSLIKNG
ncbi:MAG: endonuclease III [Candidatus Margulisiibacteriota bacterium]|nr:MAG: endonuclease III [Candidatus Margulisbacteria bacterium GWD2_39_127]OGI01286.1 MAG: endonuclease III [Candidatus Margulisbacteria bacterium GWF2_38_17]PZM83763.1 MAG: endonuclease III [Candidatus Margulisiibacteriota bacterium]HAR63045.1 endonuclease III [Candidatus Margulisiibacteriota bacterium]HCY36750.1 endonuclease III [Candidatus Margulisiibacteriota bacterium]